MHSGCKRWYGMIFIVGLRFANPTYGTYTCDKGASQMFFGFEFQFRVSASTYLDIGQSVGWAPPTIIKKILFCFSVLLAFCARFARFCAWHSSRNRPHPFTAPLNRSLRSLITPGRSSRPHPYARSTMRWGFVLRQNKKYFPTLG